MICLNVKIIFTAQFAQMPQLKSLLTISLLFISIVAFAQDKVKKAWDAASPVQWSDFQGPIDQSSSFSALTQSGFSYTWHRQVTDGVAKYTFSVSSFMDRSKSWTKPGKQSPELLRHEQKHFDISEFFARKLLEALNTHTYTDGYRTEIEGLYLQLTLARKQMQDKYDEQTNHSMNKADQAIWESYIADLLNSNPNYEQALAKEPTAR